MAGISTKEIKYRIRSMENTRQITKAMEMVAASKLRKAQDNIMSSRPYFEILSSTIRDIVNSTVDFESPYLQKRGGNRGVFIVISGDRGLAGGYNSNVLKLADEQIRGIESTVLPIGRKTVEHFKARNVKLLTDSYAEAASMSLGDCFTVAKRLCKGFLTGEFDCVYLCYTDFVSVLTQSPSCMQLLPLTPDKTGKEGTAGSDIVYEPDSTEVFERIIPEYIGGVLYGALCESRASEQAARRTAMDSATQNADEMIEELSLRYNQARQAAITQEITEIVAGSQ